MKLSSVKNNHKKVINKLEITDEMLYEMLYVIPFLKEYDKKADKSPPLIMDRYVWLFRELVGGDPNMELINKRFKVKTKNGFDFLSVDESSIINVEKFIFQNWQNVPRSWRRLVYSEIDLRDLKSSSKDIIVRLIEEDHVISLWGSSYFEIRSQGIVKKIKIGNNYVLVKDHRWLDAIASLIFKDELEMGVFNEKIERRLSNMPKYLKAHKIKEYQDEIKQKVDGLINRSTCPFGIDPRCVDAMKFDYDNLTGSVYVNRFGFEWRFLPIPCKILVSCYNKSMLDSFEIPEIVVFLKLLKASYVKHLKLQYNTDWNTILHYQRVNLTCAYDPYEPLKLEHLKNDDYDLIIRSGSNRAKLKLGDLNRLIDLLKSKLILCEPCNKTFTRDSIEDWSNVECEHCRKKGSIVQVDDNNVDHGLLLKNYGGDDDKNNQ